MTLQTAHKSRPDSGLVISAVITPAYQTILTQDALAFVADLICRFTPRVEELLARRVARQQGLDAGELPDFLPETAAVRSGDWKVAPIPAPLLDRRVEITGPVDRKMIINGLNSGARVFMADFEDASSPTWQMMMDGQVNVRDAAAGTIQWTAANGKEYRLNPETAVLMVRPRGWHMVESHVQVDGFPVPAALWDFGLYIFHNARALIAKGHGPYFYLPKMQSHLEARLWNDVFIHAQQSLDIPRGTIRATVLIETILAAFEMDEILYELREHIVGLNCGRWDFIFSLIKCFRRHPRFVLPDRSQISMATHFMESYSLLLIQTCHRRGAHAIGGMAAQIPIKNDPAANELAMLKVRKDKEREASNGHDGSWVSHPSLVPLCAEVFNQHMPGPNQIDRQLDGLKITRDDLLQVPEGAITSRGLMDNVSAALRYTESWLSGQGAVPLYNLMEDAATAEIARAQLWQWCHFPGGKLEDGRKITVDSVRELIAHELAGIRLQFGEAHFAARKYALAAQILERMIASELLPDFLTTEAYEYLER